MARIEPIPMVQADGKARALLDELVQRGGEPGPMVRAMANGPTLLSRCPALDERHQDGEDRLVHGVEVGVGEPGVGLSS